MSFQERLLKQDINISGAGDNTVITIAQGEMPTTWENGAVQILIDHINLVPTSAVNVQFKDGATTDANNGTVPQANYGGAYPLQQSQGFVLENSMGNEQDGIIRLKPNKSFVINLSAGVQVSGFIRYRLKNTN